MAGKLWIWGRQQAGTLPRAWKDGNPDEEDVVLVWGDAALPEAGASLPVMHMWNAKAHSFSLLPWREVHRRLSRVGVEAVNRDQRATVRSSAHTGNNALASGGSSRLAERWKIVRLLRVVVWQHQVLRVERMNRQEGAPAASSLHSTVLKPEEVLHRRAGKTAIKALYALQLDLAAIDLLLKEDGSCQVVSIHLPTHQKLPDQTWDWEAVVQRISERWRSSKSIRSAAAKPILVGADPEFLLMSAEGKVVPAHRYLGDGYGAGTDTVYIGGKIVRIVAELRPAPAETVDVLMARIRKLLQQAASRINDPTLRLAAGAMPAPGLALGGHIHLSGVELTPRLLRLLDSYVAFPLAMVESAGGRSRRPRYGCLGDTKLQQHGGFEYRTLPSWLLSPMLAQASIALSMLCAHEQRNLIYCPAEEDVYVEAYYSGDRNRLYQCLEPLEASMRHTAAYAELAPYIDPFIASLRRREIWDESADLRKAWRLPPFQVDRG